MEQSRIGPHHSVLLWQCSRRSMILLEGVLLVHYDFTMFLLHYELAWIVSQKGRTWPSKTKPWLTISAVAAPAAEAEATSASKPNLGDWTS